MQPHLHPHHLELILQVNPKQGIRTREQKNVLMENKKIHDSNIRAYHQNPCHPRHQSRPCHHQPCHRPPHPEQHTQQCRKVINEI
jgi:hypothetical protein